MKVVFTGWDLILLLLSLPSSSFCVISGFLYFSWVIYLHGTFPLFRWAFKLLILHSSTVLVSLSLKVKVSKVPMRELPPFLCTPLTLELQRLRGTADICLYGCDSGVTSQILMMNVSSEWFPYSFCFVRVSMYSHIHCSKFFLKCDHKLFCLHRNLKMLDTHAYKIIGSICIVWQVVCFIVEHCVSRQ